MGDWASVPSPVDKTQSAVFQNDQELQGHGIPWPRLGVDESHLPQLAGPREHEKHLKPP